MTGLLDVNVLVALLDANHTHHGAAHSWFDRDRNLGWATCPLTENGFLRVATALPMRDRLVTMSVAVASLSSLRDLAGHSFWSDDVSLCDRGVFKPARALGHRQIPDAYLLALAVHRGGRLVSFDRNIPLAAVPGANPEHVLVLEA